MPGVQHTKRRRTARKGLRKPTETSRREKRNKINKYFFNKKEREENKCQ